MQIEGLSNVVCKGRTLIGADGNTDFLTTMERRDTHDFQFSSIVVDAYFTDPQTYENGDQYFSCSGDVELATYATGADGRKLKKTFSLVGERRLKADNEEHKFVTKISIGAEGGSADATTSPGVLPGWSAVATAAGAVATHRTNHSDEADKAKKAMATASGMTTSRPMDAKARNPTARARCLSVIFLVGTSCLFRFPCAAGFAVPRTTTVAAEPAGAPASEFGHERELQLGREGPAPGDPWVAGREALRHRECCVVSVCSPEDHGGDEDEASLSDGLRWLQHRLADHGPSDVDLRARIDTTTPETALEDCARVWDAVNVVVQDEDEDEDEDDYGSDGGGSAADGDHRSVAALAELARGVSSLAERPSGQVHVYARIVCASGYEARDPPFHTDKAPLRGYVTLRGVGTEFVDRPCNPLEYAGLRALGKLGGSGDGKGSPSLRCARELEFIVMKGDYYYEYARERLRDAAGGGAGTEAGALPRLPETGWWQREFACVHRSPPGGSRRRVIVSFDLADGSDDREWHDSGQKRQWRSGMTQRKSRLVA
ncbi:unnamed protein product [Pseudo-nitzschia multistriata]|uniref:Uncharacterized protein n=1 Tax=Pseudo-nitzschia multistriata TaxID=183589 RepID=A0A448ZEG0_9STRA|nr:unnamed protein product [Pseudo-nitzschia multistriata]